MVAVDALVDTGHFLLPLLGEIGGSRAAADQKTHAGRVVDGDTCRAGHAVTAATAEIAGKLGTVPLDPAPDLLGHGHRFFHAGQELFQFFRALNAPDRLHIFKLIHPGNGKPGLIQKSAAHSLHGNEAHILFLAQPHQLHILIGGQVVEGELQGLVQAALNG